MNDANLTFTINELAVLTSVVRHSVDQPIAGIAKLQEALNQAKPGVPFHYTAAAIAAADEAFNHVTAQGYMPNGLHSDQEDAFHRAKATIAAAAVD